GGGVGGGELGQRLGHRGVGLVGGLELVPLAVNEQLRPLVRPRRCRGAGEDFALGRAGPDRGTKQHKRERKDRRPVHAAVPSLVIVLSKATTARVTRLPNGPRTGVLRKHEARLAEPLRSEKVRFRVKVQGCKLPPSPL